MEAPFELDRDRAALLIRKGVEATKLRDLHEAIGTLDRFASDPDSFNSAVTDALDHKAINRSSPDIWLAVYPLAIGDRQPLLSVNPGDGGPLLLDSHEWVYPDDEDLDPAAFTLWTLEWVVARANEMLAERGGATPRSPNVVPDHAAMSAIEREAMRDGHSAGDLAEVVYRELQAAGRRYPEDDSFGGISDTKPAPAEMGC